VEKIIMARRTEEDGKMHFLVIGQNGLVELFYIRYEESNSREEGHTLTLTIPTDQVEFWV
jgi:hypothetical protein